MSAEAPFPHTSHPHLHRRNTDFKSIQVNNWGGVLLKKLHNSYRREESCDLELVLEHDNKSIRVHAPILHVCTEYFKIQGARQGTPGKVILPEKVGAAPLLSIVQFLYTGHLSLTADNFESIRCTATILGIDVLTNLMGNRSSDHSTAVVSDKRSSGGNGGAVSKRPVSPDCPVKFIAKKRRTETESGASVETTVLKDLDSGESPSHIAEAKDDSTKGPLKRFYNKVAKLKRNPNPARARSTCREGEQLVKKLTSSDVFRKYSGGTGNSSLTHDAESTKMIMDLIKKNPKLLSDEHPTKLKIKQMSASGQERVVNVTVCSKVDMEGKRSIQIIHSPEYDPEPIRADGPWNCTRCLRAGGKILEFGSYFNCRNHMTNVHNARFDPNSCEQCGEKCLDPTALSQHMVDKHGIRLAEEATPEKSSPKMKRPKEKSFSLSDLKRRFKSKKATNEAVAEGHRKTMGARAQHLCGQRALSQDETATGRETGIGRDTMPPPPPNNSSHFGLQENNLMLSLYDSHAGSLAHEHDVVTSSSISSPSTVSSHSTCTTVTSPTSTMALPTFQEVRGIPPLLHSTTPEHDSPEPVEVVNLSVPVGGDDDEELFDMGQHPHPAIFILSDDLDQNQYLDTLFNQDNQMPMVFHESLAGTATPQQHVQHHTLQPTATQQQQGTNELNVNHQHHFPNVSNDSSCTSFNQTSHGFTVFQEGNS